MISGAEHPWDRSILINMFARERRILSSGHGLASNTSAASLDFHTAICRGERAAPSPMPKSSIRKCESVARVKPPRLSTWRCISDRHRRFSLRRRRAPERMQRIRNISGRLSIQCQKSFGSHCRRGTCRAHCRLRACAYRMECQSCRGDRTSRR